MRAGTDSEPWPRTNPGSIHTETPGHGDGTGALDEFGNTFSGGKRTLRPPDHGFGRWDFFAAHCRIDPAHSFPQTTSAGRNLITCFECVNCLTKKFLISRAAYHPLLANPFTPDTGRNMHNPRTAKIRFEKNNGKNALFRNSIDFSKRTSCLHMLPANTDPAAFDALNRHAPTPVPGIAISRRTTRNAQKCAKNFQPSNAWEGPSGSLRKHIRIHAAASSSPAHAVHMQ